MALISSSGGALKIPTPKMAGISHGGGGGFGRVPRPVHMKPPKVTAVKVPKGVAPTIPTAAGTAGGNPNDPFNFIKGLTASTDPAAIRALIDPIYAPLRAGVNDQISQLQGSSKAQADQMSQVYQAFEQYLGGMPAQIQSIYGQKGATDAQTLMAGMAGPQGAVGSHLAAQSNSDLMGQLGANWAAYAAAQPHIYALLATNNIKNMLVGANASEAKLRQSLLSLSSQEASSILSYLNSAEAKDTSLQEWAYGQKQSQDTAAQSQANWQTQQDAATANAKSTQSQAKLNYDQRQSTIAFNQWKVEQARGDKLAAAQWKKEYENRQLQEKYDAMNATDARAAKARDAAAARQQTGIAARARAAAAARAGKGPGSTSGKALGTAQKSIQSDISTRTFRDVNQAITYYLNAYGGLVRAGYRNEIIRYVRQAWATKVPKKKSAGGGLLAP